MYDAAGHCVSFKFLVVAVTWYVENLELWHLLETSAKKSLLLLRRRLFGLKSG
jgi:hypothetical protein